MKILEGTMYYSLAEVGSIIGRTKATLLRWFEYESTLPESQRVLPNYIQVGQQNAKYFKATDIDKFYEFMKNTKRGSMKNISDSYNGNLTKHK